MTSSPFQVRFTVRSYELDTQSHLNSAVYQYGEQVRWEYLRAAGIPLEKLFESGVGAVQLESTIQFGYLRSHAAAPEALGISDRVG